MKLPGKGVLFLLASFVAVTLLVLLYLGALFIAHDYDLDFIAIDSCLDRGGRWDDEGRRCETSLR